MAPSTNSKKTIKDVVIKDVIRHSDDRGFFSEIVKEGEQSFKGPIRQTSTTTTYPGIIKAFHYHKKQWDIWHVIKGSARVVLYDTRKDSPTYKVTNVFYVGENNPMVIAIPPLVLHGYQVLGNENLTLLYHTTQAYNSDKPDEYRIAFDDPAIGFDWSIKNR